MTKVYAIRENFDHNVELFQIEISGETEKRFNVDDYRIYRSIINKKELYYMNYGVMFGTDMDLLIKTWNEYKDDKIKELEKRLEQEKLTKYTGGKLNEKNK